MGESKGVYYAIRQKSTGSFMPEYGSRKSRGGYTRDEPHPISEFPPRLFKTRRSANIALSWWLKGELKYRITYDSLYGESVDLVVEKRSHRVPRDMHVVPITIVFGE